MDAVLEGGNIPVDTDPLATASANPPSDAADVPDPPAAKSKTTATALLEEDIPTSAPVPAAKAVASAAAAKPAAAPANDTVVAARAPAADPEPAPPAAPKAAAPAAKPVAKATAGAGSALVQVSSQRSEEAARSTFRDLQAKFPSILGSYQPNIVRADLGAKGVYYRVRVGPFAGADAARLCENLKSAGGDCIISR
jgi:hypothetical protein